MDFFIDPKPKVSSANWQVTDETKEIIRSYARYTGYSENELVDKVLKQLLHDPKFIDWTKSKRRNKKITKLIEQYGEQDEKQIETPF